MANESSNTGVADAGNLLGAFLPAAAATFGFIGLSGDEVTSVLRNENHLPPIWILTLMTVTAVVGVASIFVAQKLQVWLAVSLVLLAAAAIPATFWIVQIPSSNDTTRWVAIGGVIVLVIASVSAFVFAADSPKAPHLRAQPVLLTIAVILLAAAIAGGLRLEVNSQAKSTHVQLEPSFVRDANGTSLKLKISASKLTAEDVVLVSLRAVPRVDAQGTIVNLAGSVQTPCSSGPSGVACDFVSGFVLNPDAKGQVDDSVAILIDDAKYQHLALRALPCDPNAADLSKATCDNADDTQMTRVDIRLTPRPVAPTTTSTTSTAP